MSTAANPPDTALLDVRGLTVSYRSAQGTVPAVNDFNLSIRRGEAWAVVGESGSGKSTLALALMGLLDPRAAQVTGEALFADQNLLALSRRALQSIRGRQIAMIFQEPMTSLTPYLPIGQQVSEPLRRHLQLSRDEAAQRANELLAKMGIADAPARSRQYPHEFSGGMRQRAMIAMAMACNPDLLIADEPTTALDVTIQAQILDLLREQLEQSEMGLLLITHDLGVVAGLCDYVAVMYAGEVVECGSVSEIFRAPAHPYTRALLDALPRTDRGRQHLVGLAGQPPTFDRPTGCLFAPRCPHTKPECEATHPPLRQDTRQRQHRCLFEIDHPPTNSSSATQQQPSKDALLELKSLTVRYPKPKGWWQPASYHQVVNSLSLTLHDREVLGLVGESGCGKTTLMRAIIQLLPIHSGQLLYQGEDVTHCRGPRQHRLRQAIQLVFQDPFASLNPRFRCQDLIAEPLINFGLASKADAQRQARELMAMVGLGQAMAERYPHEFSGGQRQRIGIARALAVKPKILLCDEPVSALDVSIQAQIINLLRELQQELGLALLFISHDLGVVRQLADRLAIMYQGEIVELGDADRVYAQPEHPYTRQLLSAVPVPEPPTADKVPTS